MKILETRRLILRCLVPADLDSLFAHQASIRTVESAGLRFEREIELEDMRCSLYAIAKAAFPLTPPDR